MKIKFFLQLFVLYLGYTSVVQAEDIPEDVILMQREDQLSTLSSASGDYVIVDVRSTLGKKLLQQLASWDWFSTRLLDGSSYVLMGDHLIGVNGLNVQNFSKASELEVSSIPELTKGVAGKYNFSSITTLHMLLEAVPEVQAVGNLVNTKDVLVVLSRKSWNHFLKLREVQRSYKVVYITAAIATPLAMWELCLRPKWISPSGDKLFGENFQANTVRRSQYEDIFWPQNETPLTERAWVDHCTQELVVRYEDHIVKQVDAEVNGHMQCTVCMEENAAQAGFLLRCNCNDDGPLFFCRECLYSDVANHSLDCKNNSACNKLLPYMVMQRACDGGIFEVTRDRILNEGRRGHVAGHMDDALQAAIDAPDAVTARYLNQLVSKIDNVEDGLKTVSCTQQNCKFQALVEKNTALREVSCYFHSRRRICVQCNACYTVGERHRCRGVVMFKDIKKRREANSMPCPHCSVETQRTDACMHMTCSKCRYHWCWYCVWHFYGEDGPEHIAKRRAYVTLNAYNTRHVRVYHNSNPYFHNDRHVRDEDDPYRKHCHLGKDCMCKRTDASNTFLSHGGRPNH